MKTTPIILLCTLGLGGCKDYDLHADVEVGDGGIVYRDRCDGGAIDMAPVQPPCAAAVGLQGKNLFCVDFKDYANIPSLPGAWVFADCSPSNPAGVRWTISQNRLQLDASNFSTFIGECKFTLPALSGTDFNNYSSFILSVVHTVDIADGYATSAPAQLAQVYMGQVMTGNLLASTTSRQTKLQWSQTLSKATLPGGAGGPYQPIFNLRAPVSAGGTFKGWQLDSIAINGLP